MEEKGDLDQYIGVATTQKCPENFSELEVPTLTWAIFESTGPFPSTLHETWGRIYSEWFPSERRNNSISIVIFVFVKRRIYF